MRLTGCTHRDAVRTASRSTRECLDQIAPTTDLEFAVDVREVELDGLDRDEERVRDLAIRLAHRRELGDTQFAGGEQFVPAWSARHDSEHCKLLQYATPTTSSGERSESLARYEMYADVTLAELDAGDPVRFELPCAAWNPAGTKPNFSSTTGIWDAVSGYGNSDHAGNVRSPSNSGLGNVTDDGTIPQGANGEHAFTWETTGTPPFQAGEVLDTYRILYQTASGDEVRVLFHVRAVGEADLATALTGPTALGVDAAGSQASYTATVTNNGPQTAASARVKFQLPAGAAHVSTSGGSGSDACTANGQLVTCTIANLASGASRTFTSVVKYTPGASLTLPTMGSISAMAELLGDDTVDPTDGNDTATALTSLTAAPTCVAGQTGTPPNCVKPVSIVGGTRNETFKGTAGADTFKGGSGNEVFRAGPGGDTANGGGGNDRIYGAQGNDRFNGGIGNDRLYGGKGDDVLRGGAGDDLVHGGDGKDDPRGGADDDRVSCGTGPKERAFGDSGDDIVGCVDGKGGDTVNGGTGSDTCVGDIGDIFVGCENIVRKALPKS